MKEMQRRENEEAENAARELRKSIKQKKLELEQMNEALREQKQEKIRKEAQIDKEIEGK